MSEQAGIIVIVAIMVQFLAALLFAAWRQEKGYQMGYKHGYQTAVSQAVSEPESGEQSK